MRLQGMRAQQRDRRAHHPPKACLPNSRSKIPRRCFFLLARKLLWSRSPKCSERKALRPIKLWPIYFPATRRLPLRASFPPCPKCSILSP